MKPRDFCIRVDNVKKAIKHIKSVNPRCEFTVIDDKIYFQEHSNAHDFWFSLQDIGIDVS